MFADPVHQARQFFPTIVGDLLALGMVGGHGVEQLAIDVQLQLTISLVADADGAGLPVTLEVR
jgi:putative intracellular protease/amidase